MSEFPHTTAALPAWKAAKADLDARIESSMDTVESCLDWLNDYDKAADALRDAFYADTKDRNSRAALNDVPPSDIERFVETGSWT